MIKIETTGGEQVLARFRSLPDRLRAELRKSMMKATVDLQGHVKADKLSGQVLNVRTNRLRSSIAQRVTDLSNGVEGITGTNVAYAGIHEYGGQIRTRLGTGKNPPKKGGKEFAQMPERSFLRSALQDHRNKIRQDLTDAVVRSVQR